MIALDTTLPALDVNDASGNTLNLKDFAGQSSVLIYFMRTSTCQVCVNHVRDLGKHKAELDAHGITVLVAIPEGAEAVAKWQAKSGSPFIGISAPSGSTHAEFGLNKKIFGSMQETGVVLADASGRVRYTRSAVIATGAYNWEELYSAMKEHLPLAA
ncbi:peroxiredoxin [Paenarthrobacter ureafaciens]|uniref:peroxiredoxin family protein n=1 Tax=Paenarthrobacter ureafaciens TaxID=37931 RepID=UPI0015B92246|nr:redoxin domain-containing protein [Paenarthrobacter ureafaciens]MEC3854099.1 redoxin domain-containing protein [Paenarthrobacter ureafaciens]NWL26322.1 peroxiredoxin [Paenarthrobacter ureafaciens]